MTGQAGVRKILNDVIEGDSIIDYFNITDATGMYPGAAVKTGASDHDIVVCGAAELAIGWLGYGACNGPDKPATRDTIYLVDAEAPVHSGGGFRVRCRGSTLTAAKGDELAITTAGVVTNATVGTDYVAAKAAETVSSASHVWATSTI